MAQRNTFPSSQLPNVDHNQNWNHPHAEHHSHLGNGSFVHPPDDAARTAVLRANDYPSSSFSNYMETNSGLLYDPYLHHHSSTGSSSRFPPPNFNWRSTILCSFEERQQATSSMAQRNTFPSSQMPNADHNQNWNHPHAEHHSHLGAGNGSFVHRLDDAARTAVLRANDYPSSSFSNYMEANSGLLYDPYLHHPSFTGSSSRFPPPNFSWHSTVNPQTEIARTSFGWNASGYYTSGSSSNLHISGDPLQQNPLMRSRPLDPASNTQNHGSDNLWPPAEEFQRNVGSRHNHTYQVDINPSSNMPCHLHAAGNLSGLGMEGQFRHAAMPLTLEGRTFSPDASFTYERSQSLAQPNIVNAAVGTSSSLPTSHGPLTWGIEAGSSGYNQRSYPYRSSSSSGPVGFDNASWEGAGPSRMEIVGSSRYSRPLSITGRNSFSNGRTRNSRGRLALNFDEDTVPSRWLSEDALMMDRSSFYESRDLFDQHSDMRIDVDSMSYEELLSLGERIGVVSTGLSEETISKCLQETTHHSSNRSLEDQDGGRCVICLEGYQGQDKVGRLSCRHDFHVGCIKNWLLIKNACPVCRAAAFCD